MAYLAISHSFTRKNYRFIFKEMSNLRYFMYLLGLLKILPFVAINIYLRQRQGLSRADQRGRNRGGHPERGRLAGHGAAARGHR